MLAALILSTQLLAQPQIALPAGEPIQLDGRIEPAEWAGAFRISRPIEEGRKLKFLLMRTGPWLAMGVEAGRAYVGETLRLYVANEAGTMVSFVTLGFGQPTLPPVAWRRSAPELVAREETAAEAPRACRLRLRVGEADAWSAEYLLRLSALGIGRGDTRRFGLMLALGADAPRSVLYLVLPQGAQSPLDRGDYAVLEPQAGWGGDERWDPVTPEISLEFDDHELLHLLGLEQTEMQGREELRHLLIRAATRPRIESEIARLRARLEAGKRRNPTLPAWDYYLGRLLHEGNHRTEARAVIDGLPRHLLDLAPFLDLAAKHYFDSEAFEEAIEVCEAHREARSAAHFLSLARQGQSALAHEQRAREEDAKKEAKNPRVRLHTSKGKIDCELYEDDAPNAVRNFMGLASDQHFYDGQRFRVAGAMFAGAGDPRAIEDLEGEDGPAWRLRSDTSLRPMLRGTLATVPMPDGTQHGSRFVVTVVPFVQDQTGVVVFGRVIEGQEVVDRLGQGDLLESIEILRRREHDYDTASARIR